MVTTRSGDDGKSRWSGRVEAKDGALLEALGSIDELQATLGVAKSKVESLKSKSKIEKIEEDLGQIMAELASAKFSIFNFKFSIKRMEEEIKELGKGKIVEGRFLKIKEMDPWLNWARTICRRCERRVVTLKAPKDILVYFNRLSDYLFLLSRK